MQLEYELDKRDLVVFYKKAYGNNIFLKPQVFIIAMILATFIRILYGPSTITRTNEFNVRTITHASFFTDYIFYLIVLIVIIFIIRFKINRAIKKVIEIDPTIIGKRKLELLNDHIIFSNLSEKTEYSNFALKNIVNDSEYYYLYFNQNKIPNKMIPKRYLIDDSIIKELQNLLSKNAH
jgi:hypothetical protein